MLIDEATEAHAAVRCSDAVYEFEPVQDFELVWQLELNNQAVGLYASSVIPGWHLLVFRGSEELEDWIVNFTVWPPHQQAHRGYGLAWASLRPHVLQALEQQQIDHLTLCGHSMGGALAQLAVLDIPRSAHLITFGSTKAVSRSLADAIASKAAKGLRFVFGCDVAPLFPFTELHHSHPAVQIGPPRTWWRLLLGPWDHRMANYLKALND